MPSGSLSFAVLRLSSTTVIHMKVEFYLGDKSVIFFIIHRTRHLRICRCLAILALVRREIFHRYFTILIGEKYDVAKEAMKSYTSVYVVNSWNWMGMKTKPVSDFWSKVDFQFSTRHNVSCLCIWAIRTGVMTLNNLKYYFSVRSNAYSCSLKKSDIATKLV